MGLQVELILVVALVISCCGAIQARISKRAIFFDGLAHGTVRSEEQLYASGVLCEMCEQYSTQALSYLNENDTQTEIVSLLYNTCSKLQPLRQQCITLVDYYVPLFFREVAKITPDDLCDKLHLCKEANAIKLPTSGPSCKLCHKAVLEILTKLQDRNTQCYELVSQYSPQVLSNAEAFLGKANICSSVCKADVAATEYIFTN